MTINSRNKGATYERKIAKILSDRFGVKFSRTPGSGAFGTVNSINSLQGDIICTDENYKWPYFIECKKYATVNLYHFAQGMKSCTITKWLDKLKEQKSKKAIGLLIFAENRGKDMILATIEDRDCVPNRNGVIFVHNQEQYWLTTLEEWLQWRRV